MVHIKVVLTPVYGNRVTSDLVTPVVLRRKRKRSSSSSSSGSSSSSKSRTTLVGGR